MTDQRIQVCISSSHDQIFQINRAIESVIIIFYIDCSDIIVLFCFCNELPHCLLHGQTSADLDEVRRHLAANLILFIGTDQLDVFLGLFIHQFNQLFTFRLIYFFQNIYSIIRIHVLDNICCLFQLDLFQILSYIIYIGKYLGHSLHAQYLIELLTLFFIEFVQCRSDIIIMVIIYFLRNAFIRLTTTDQIHQFFDIIRLFYYFIFHNFAPFSIFSA